MNAVILSLCNSKTIRGVCEKIMAEKITKLFTNAYGHSKALLPPKDGRLLRKKRRKTRYFADSIAIMETRGRTKPFT